MKSYQKKLYLAAVAGFMGFLATGCATTKSPYSYKGLTKNEIHVHKSAEKFLRQAYEGRTSFQLLENVKIDSVKVNNLNRTVGVFMSREMGEIPFREQNTNAIYSQLRNDLGRRFRTYKVTLYTLKKPTPIQKLIPNYFRPTAASFDTLRMPSPDSTRAIPVVRDASRPYEPVRGLLDHTIALWPSHGWYYNNLRDRWEWQRPRLFQTVEDKLPLSFTLKYLVPMLENAGANVFVARERDTQTHEVVVDNDSSGTGSSYSDSTSDPTYQWMDGDSTGFAIGHPPYRIGDNPFKMGSYRQVSSASEPTAQAQWVPDIPSTGYYAVYVSYHQSDQNVTDAHYSVLHEGGKTDFRVNQQIGGGTWIYLGKFKFKKGVHPDSGSVVLTNQTSEGGNFVTADGVRFGGGMGDVARNGKISGRPRYLEAARYYFQYAGMPDTLVYDLNKDRNDYNDDYQSRGEWVNYLHGAPDGPNRDRSDKGLGIPVDLSLAFHTDAGIAPKDSIIGTLSIYSYPDVDTTYHFPGGKMSRLANRDFADVLQTQVVHDIRAQYDKKWVRRELKDGLYSEAARPNVPSALLELLSHQNFTDVKLAMDPRFQFSVGRSIYKAMLKFLATEYHQRYVVQPLPVDHMQAAFLDSTSVQLKWQAVKDTLEPSAVSSGYIVYVREGDGGFDNGHFVADTTWTMHHLQQGKIYSFKVSAVNAGGQSFPSEILSVCHMPDQDDPVLLVNDFDRICAPSGIDDSNMIGFTNYRDMGVDNGYGIDYTGSQYNFNADSPYRTNDQPGTGASHSYAEARMIPGNTHDYPYRYGKSLKAAGYSFVSSSNEAVMDGQVSLSNYSIVGLIAGEQKRTVRYPYRADSTKGMTFLVFPNSLQEGNHRLLRKRRKVVHIRSLCCERFV